MGPVEPAYRIEALYTRHVDPQRTDRKIANSLRVEKGRNSVASETTTHPLATNRARKTKRKIQSNTIQPLDRSQVRGRTGTDELANTEHRAMWITRRSPTRHSLRVESFGQRENKTVQRQQEIKAPIDATLCHLQRPTDPSCKTQQPKRANHRLPANPSKSRQSPEVALQTRSFQYIVFISSGSTARSSSPVTGDRFLRCPKPGSLTPFACVTRKRHG